ncbi:phage tail tape measure protein [Jeongeupia chitinilytica]|uniref:Phage tail tape measure protein n=1 Tax=Jeongeupia chitinilytica TaxID=1041641 RepID=A0ABQ3GXE2_9NEIS|nr:phage tail tape measure protein [Jeongeupia chitinilytica]GHD59831.1 phage tail tape measure protein [Jeongeupia chitinilytica]
MAGNDLKLRVIMNAVDRVTRPLKQITAGSGDAAKAIKATRVQIKQLERAQGQVNALRELQQQTKATAVSMRSAEAYAKALGSQMKQTANPTRKMVRQFKQAEKAAGDLRKKHGEQTESLKQLRSAMNASGIRNLTQHEQQLKAQTEAANGTLAKQEAHLARLNKQAQRMHAARANYDKTIGVRDKLAGAGVATTAAGAVMGVPIASMIKDYSSYEDAMLGIARQVEGARDANGKLTPVYYEMGDAIKALSRQIPMATTEIAALVEGGARMGIQGKDNLLAFARTAALAGTAFDLPVDQLGEDLGKIANLYKIPIKDIGQLGDAINYLDDNAQSKGADIIEVMQRIAGSTGSMNYKEAAALGSTFLSLGASPEIAATATKAMVRELQIAEKQPARFRKGLAELGLSAKQIQADMAKDSTGTILKVMEAVRRLPETRRMGVMVDLFGKEYGDDAAKLADNLGEYRKQLKLVNEEKAKGSMQREGDAKNDTLSAQWQMVKNQLFNESSNLGASLRQPLMELMKGLGELLGTVNRWVKANPQLAASIVKIVAVLAVLLTTLGGIMIAIAGLLGPMAVVRLSLSVLGIKVGGLAERFTSAGKAGGKAASLLRKAWDWAGSGLAGVLKRAGQVAGYLWRQGPAIMRAMLGFGRGLLMAFAAPLKIFGQLIWWVARALTVQLIGALQSVALFLLTNPIGWAIMAIAAAAYLIYRYWEPIKAWFKSLWAEISAAFDGGIAGIGALIVNWSPIGLFHRALATVLSWFGIELPAKFTDFGGMVIDGFINGLMTKWESLKSTIKEIASSVTDSVKSTLGIHSPSRVFAQLGGFTMAGLNQGLQDGQGGPIKSVIGLGQQLAAIGAGFAIGTGGATGINIDRRPPIAASAGAPAGAGANINLGGIHIYAAPGMDTNAIAQQVRAEIEKLTREQAARGRSRLVDNE